MRMRATLSSSLVLITVAILAVGPASAQKEEVDESTICQATNTSGAGEKYLQTCVTQTGNLLIFRSPQSASDHILSEGYLICTGINGYAWSTGAIEGNFAFPTTHTGTSNVRTTVDGRFKLTQAFGRDATEKEMAITMTLKNLGPGAVNDVRLVRYFDADADGDFLDIYLRSTDAVMAVDAVDAPYGFGGGRGIMLGVLTPEISHSTTVQSFNEFYNNDHNDCDLHSIELTPTLPGDWTGRVTFFLGTINAGVAKTVKVFYKRL